MDEYNTLEYYNKNAELYFEQTVTGNFEENYNEFLNEIPSNSYILDFGCGSGRDSKYFIQKGYKVKSIDGSLEMCKLASRFIGQDVKCMNFEELNDKNIYDGIWACASILHVPKEELPRVLSKMLTALKNGGTIYISVKKGEGYKIEDGKYYNFITRKELENIICNLNENAKIIKYFETFSSTKRPEKVVWSNYLIRKL